MAGRSSGLGEWAVTGLGPGSLIAGYRVEARIGVGGMAMVLRARDEALGRMVALKILAPALADDPDFRQRFVRESRAVAAVDHPHIIPVYAAGEADGILYLAMRHISGGDLRSVMQREGPLPGERAVALLFPIASALDAAHRAGLVHRDVKPANILIDTSLDRPEHPYLSDFGLAKGAASSTGLTGTGQYLGTPDYSAPEQISGRQIRPQTDQYSLACVAYTVLAGSLPFARGESMAVLWAHMYDQPPQLTDQRPDLSAAVDQVLARAMAKIPNERFATCGEFINALSSSLAEPLRTVSNSGFAELRPSATEPGTWQRRSERGVQAAPAADWHTPTSSARSQAGRSQPSFRSVTAPADLRPASPLEPPSPGLEGSPRRRSGTSPRSRRSAGGASRPREIKATSHRASRRARRVTVGAVVVVVVAIGGVLVKYEFPGPSAPSHTIVAPQTVNGYTRSANLEKQLDVTNMTDQVAAASSGRPTAKVSAVYEHGSLSTGSGTQMFLFSGGTLVNADPSASIATFKQGHPEATGVSAGPLGGQAACTETTVNGQSASECVWFDNDTFGALTSPTMSVSELATTVDLVRPSLELYKE